MAIRLGAQVVSGVVDNVNPNHVHGWLAFGPRSQIQFSLVGPISGELAGKKIEFEVEREESPNDEPDDSLLAEMARAQIGAVGDMRLRTVRVPLSPIEDHYKHAKLGEPLPVKESPCLSLEWFGQNGRVVAEIVDPVIRILSDQGDQPGEIPPDPLPDLDEEQCETYGPSITGIAFDEAGNPVEFDPLEEQEDPYGLFPPDLEQQIHQSDAATDFECEAETESGPREWDEVIPDIDPETKALYDKWDEIYGQQNDELLSNLLDPPMQLPPPDDVSSEDEARHLVRQIAANLARLSVSIDICRHFTMLQTYRWLIEQVLTEGHAHPELPDYDIVMTWSTYECCEKCEAEFESEL